jgi:glycosyltransferase involved in cell wall biosynthesis
MSPSVKPTVSVVAPVHCEEAVLDAFYARVAQTFQTLADEVALELLFVDDGSSDRSLEILLRLREHDPRVKVIHLSRNFGHQIAVTAGVDHATGDAVVLIDADLQDPPELIAEMLRKWREGYKVVYGVREQRNGESAFKLLSARWFYRALAGMSEVDIPLDAGDFRLMDRVVVDGLRRMREESRYMRGMVSWLGYRQCGVPYTRAARYAGSTTHTLPRMARFALNGITSFSEAPLLVLTWAGAAVTLCGLVFLAYVAADKLLLNAARSGDGWASLMATVIFFGGVQLLSVGVLGQYLGRVHREVKRRPLYMIAGTWGVSDHTAKSST